MWAGNRKRSGVKIPTRRRSPTSSRAPYPAPNLIWKKETENKLEEGDLRPLFDMIIEVKHIPFLEDEATLLVGA